MKLLRTFAARRNSGVECVSKHHVPRVSGQYRPHLNRHLGVADASARVGEAEGAAGSEPKELALPNGDSAYRGKRGRHTAPTHDHLDRTPPRYCLLQHSRHRMARGLRLFLSSSWPLVLMRGEIAAAPQQEPRAAAHDTVLVWR